MLLRRPRRPADGSRTRLTGRGRTLGLAGLVGAVTGLLLGVRPLVQVGALLLLAVAAGLGQLALEARAHRRGALRLERHVRPAAVVVGGDASVEVTVTSVTPALLGRLGVSERAARELSGGRPLRARLRRSPDALTLTYPVRPVRRGRWAVGPLEVRHGDAFGVATRRGPLGHRTSIAVRPATVALTLHESTLSDDHDRASAGARTPAPDDASLREYRTGDDLRRVHWRSSARRGHLLVRQDEQAGRRTATVLLDTPVDDAAMEWSVSLAASVALALADGGHQVRLIGGDDPKDEDHLAGAREVVLDQAVDLTRATDEDDRRRRLRQTVDGLTTHPDGRELVFAVVGPQDDDGLAMLARAGGAGTGWALVRTSPTTDPRDAAHQRTVEGLRRLGWVAAGVDVGEPLEECWSRLVRSQDRSPVLT